MQRRSHWFLVTLIVGCSGVAKVTHERVTPPAARPSASQAEIASPIQVEVLSKDQLRMTARGDTFIAPARFRLAQVGPVSALEAPEGDLTIKLVEVEASDGASAVERALAQAGESVRPVKVTHAYRAKQGWERGYEVEYVTSPTARQQVIASARGRGELWTVILVAGSNETYDKRAAAIELVKESLRPSGYERETLAGRQARALDAERLTQITTFVEEAREKAGIPGLAFGLLQNDQLVFSGGFGVRELGKPEQVDEHTLFGIASNTKALTTLLLAILVDEGKLAWDSPVTSVYPEFELADAEATRRVQVKHLVCACTGLPRRDWKFFFEYGQTTAKDVFAELARTQPTTGFGETFQYSNPLATAAGFIAGHAAFPDRELGAAYDAAMRGRVFKPLRMQDTTFEVKAMLRKNHASPHAQDFNEHVAVGPLELSPLLWPWRPTGGVWSSVSDLLHYLRLELQGGLLPSGKRLVSEVNLLERRKPQVAMREDEYYGMGLRVRTDWGVRVVFHTGRRLGFASEVFFLPDHGIAGVLLMNADSGTIVREPIMRRVVEVLFDARQEAAGDLDAAVAGYDAVIDKERAGYLLPPDPAGVALLAGRYSNAELGEITVKKVPPLVIFDFGEWASSMATRKNSDASLTFMTTDTGELGFEFHVIERGGQRLLVTRELQQEYEFVETR